MSDFIEFISLSDPNVRYVVLGMILLGASAAVVGCFTFLRKRALVGDAIAHSVLPGVCLAFILLDTKHPLVLLGGAFVTGWLSLVAIDLITRHSRIKADAAIGLTLSVFFGVGIMLLTMIQRTGNAAQAGLDKFLFGKAASLVGGDVVSLGLVSIILLVVVVLFFKEFALISFDPDFAVSIGLPVRRVEIVLSTITVLAVATGIQAVGVVLMAAILITPAAAARYWTNKLPVMVLLAAFFGAFSGIVGAYVSYQAPAMPTGPWVVVVLSFIAFGSILFAPERGVVSKYVQQRRYRFQIMEENILKLYYQLGERDGEFFAARTVPEIQSKRHIARPKLLKGLKRLCRKKLVCADGAGGWIMTENGKRIAQRQVRLHRLWELYLNKYVHIASDHVHDNAEAIEHIITPELEAELEQLLDYPTVDPHDSRIPEKVVL